jgi:hypothetical protein
MPLFALFLLLHMIACGPQVPLNKTLPVAERWSCGGRTMIRPRSSQTNPQQMGLGCAGWGFFFEEKPYIQGGGRNYRHFGLRRAAEAVRLRIY